MGDITFYINRNEVSSKMVEKNIFNVYFPQKLLSKAWTLFSVYNVILLVIISYRWFVGVGYN